MNCHIFVFKEILTPLNLIYRVCFFLVFFCFSFNAQKVEIVIEKQIHMHLNFIDQKISFFCDFQCFVLSPDLEIFCRQGFYTSEKHLAIFTRVGYGMISKLMPPIDTCQFYPAHSCCVLC